MSALDDPPPPPENYADDCIRCLRRLGERQAAMGMPLPSNSAIASPEARAMITDGKQAVRDALGTLTAREAEILRMRFGMDRPRVTLRAVGEHFSLSWGRIREIEMKALWKLRYGRSSKMIENASELLEAGRDDHDGYAVRDLCETAI